MYMRAHKKEGSAAAFVIRDCQENLPLLRSKLANCNSLYASELEALERATDHAENCGWHNIIRECDAKNVVGEV